MDKEEKDGIFRLESVDIFIKALGQLPRGKLPPNPNSNANSKPNPNPNQGAIFLEGNCPDTICFRIYHRY